MFAKLLGIIVILMFVIFSIGCSKEQSNLDPFLTDIGKTPFDGAWINHAEKDTTFVWVNTKRDSIIFMGLTEIGFALSFTLESIKINKDILSASWKIEDDTIEYILELKEDGKLHLQDPDGETTTCIKVDPKKTSKYLQTARFTMFTLE